MLVFYSWRNRKPLKGFTQRGCHDQSNAGEGLGRMAMRPGRRVHEEADAAVWATTLKMEVWNQEVLVELVRSGQTGRYIS